MYDSLAKAPLVGAAVRLVSSTPGSVAPIVGITDSLGNYQLDGVPPRTYVIGFYHALLDWIGIEPPAKRITIPHLDETGALSLTRAAAEVQTIH